MPTSSPGAIHANYDVAPDGRHLLMARTVGNTAEIIVALNWLDEARRRLAR